MKGMVHSIESFGLVDGPGVRFVLFLKGCALRCRYCHNPDTWCPGGGKAMEAREALDRALRCKPYWKENGGITVSGGEPLLQPDFLLEFFQLAKAAGVHTALDTAGQPFREDEAYLTEFDKLMEYTDLVILDIKAMDPARHKALTGKTNENILAMARHLSDIGKPMWIRHVLVPGLTDGEEELLALRDFLGELKTVERFELLPYHTLGLSKWEGLGLSCPLQGFLPPTAEEMERAYALVGMPMPK